MGPKPALAAGCLVCTQSGNSSLSITIGPNGWITNFYPPMPEPDPEFLKQLPANFSFDSFITNLWDYFPDMVRRRPLSKQRHPVQAVCCSWRLFALKCAATG